MFLRPGCHPDRVLVQDKSKGHLPYMFDVDRPGQLEAEVEQSPSELGTVGVKGNPPTSSPDMPWNTTHCILLVNMKPKDRTFLVHRG